MLPIRIFFTKLFHWEYWPFGIIQLPLFVMWVYYALRERSLFYFSASNPGILTGGMMGESKFEVLELVPHEYKPKTIFIKTPSTIDAVMQQMKEAGLGFPIIFKPDMGERGWMVKRIRSREEAILYLHEIKIDFIVQELVELPLEFGVYYTRFPSEENGFVNSITGKEFLFVEGDGKTALQNLILKNDRAAIQWAVLKEKYENRLKEILKPGERMELVSIGNHCLGTKFINCNHLINPKLIHSFDKLSKQIDGFYFGRYDLRCATLEDLENGKVKIVELNGCGAEPAHIYHPRASLFKGIRDLIVHWKNLYRVSHENHKRGIPYLSYREGKLIYQKFKAVKY
jgi:hypothetical protein